MFLTNDFVLPALMIAKLYKMRWQVELFFKWIKQHLKIKSFYGYNESAVRTQLWVEVSVYCLLAIIKKEVGGDRDLHEIQEILSVSVFQKMPILQDFSRKGQCMDLILALLILGLYVDFIPIIARFRGHKNSGCPIIPIFLYAWAARLYLQNYTEIGAQYSGVLMFFILVLAIFPIEVLMVSVIVPFFYHIIFPDDFEVYRSPAAPNIPPATGETKQKDGDMPP